MGSVWSSGGLADRDIKPENMPVLRGRLSSSGVSPILPASWRMWGQIRSTVLPPFAQPVSTASITLAGTVSAIVHV